MSVTRLIAVGLIACMPVYAFPASFDCLSATTDVEKMICSTPDLSLDDENLAESYQRALRQDSGAQAGQREWLAKRNQCGDADCLRAAYIGRLDQLSSMPDDRPASEGSTVPTIGDANAVAQATATADAALNPQAASPSNGDSPRRDSLVDPQAPSPISATPVEASQVTDANTAPTTPQTASTTAVEQTTGTSPGGDAASVPTASEGKSDFWSDVKACGVIAAIVTFLIFRTKCSKCGKLFAKQELGRDLVDEQYGFETVTRQDKHKDSTGQVFKTVERQEQVQVVHRAYNVFHRCRHCDHRWNTMKTTKTSG
ncbi:lysozyme inhibitor LprI family protein [Caballeronia sp. M23-90]